MNIWIARALATFYLSVAFVDLVKTYIHATTMKHATKDELHWSGKILNRKPFICTICMAFYIAFLLSFLPYNIVIVPAIAGGATLLFALKTKLETIIV